MQDCLLLLFRDPEIEEEGYAFHGTVLEDHAQVPHGPAVSGIHEINPAEGAGNPTGLLNPSLATVDRGDNRAPVPDDLAGGGIHKVDPEKVLASPRGLLG